MATTSSVLSFVEEFNQFFKCSSNEGRCKRYVFHFCEFLPVIKSDDSEKKESDDSEGHQYKPFFNYFLSRCIYFPFSLFENYLVF